MSLVFFSVSRLPVCVPVALISCHYIFLFWVKKDNLVSLQYKLENKLAAGTVAIANTVSPCRLYAFLQILE